MIRPSIIAASAAVLACGAAARAPVRPPPRLAKPPAQHSITSLRCLIQGSSAPAASGRANPTQLLRQKIMVQNISGAPLVHGEIDFTIGLVSGSGLERPIAKVPTSMGRGETVQVASAYMATDCAATFTRSRLAPAG